jgi:SsrA-binding protein
MTRQSPSPDEKKVLVRNKKALHDYFVEETVEAGLVLMGSEVKSLREARAVLSDAYVLVRAGEAWLINMQVTEYPWANRWNHEPKRDRKLLLHHREIQKLADATEREGYTVIPLEVYLKGGRMKALLAVCKGKKHYDKRQDQKRKDAEREVASALRRR